MMNKQIKNRWVKALRSGKYRQAHGMLYSAGSKGYCCLGVLCAVQGDDPAEWDCKNEQEVEEMLVVNKVPKYLAAGLYTLEMKDLANRNDDGVILNTGRHYDPHSFDEIADFVEHNL